MQSKPVAALNTEPSRAPADTIVTPEPEFLKIFAGPHYPNGKLAMVIEGKSITVSMSRRRIFQLLAECSEALMNMEPGR